VKAAREADNSFNTYKKREHSLEFVYFLSSESLDLGNLFFGERVALYKGIMLVTVIPLLKCVIANFLLSMGLACAKWTNHLEEL